MAIFVLSYELRNPNISKQNQVIKIIEEHQAKQLAPTTYLVNLEDKDIFQEKLQHIIDVNDKLFIAEIASPFSTRRDVKVWIRSRDIL